VLEDRVRYDSPVAAQACEVQFVQERGVERGGLGGPVSLSLSLSLSPGGIPGPTYEVGCQNRQNLGRPDLGIDEVANGRAPAGFGPSFHPFDPVVVFEPFEGG
jgi:hypothetical protein